MAPEHYAVVAAIRFQSRAAADRGRLPAIPRKSWQIAGNPSVAENAPFSDASRD